MTDRKDQHAQGYEQAEIHRQEAKNGAGRPGKGEIRPMIGPREEEACFR
jgi:hypothetical protein